VVHLSLSRHHNLPTDTGANQILPGPEKQCVTNFANSQLPYLFMAAISDIMIETCLNPLVRKYQCSIHRITAKPSNLAILLLIINKSFMLLACADDINFYFNISLILRPLSHEAVDVYSTANILRTLLSRGNLSLM
jgi:hypothetical protein